MSMSMVQEVIDELLQMRHLEKVYLNGYDEPSLNPQLINILKLCRRLNARSVVFTNATGLTQSIVDELATMDLELDIDIHVSTSNEEQFRRLHGVKIMRRALKNVEYAASKLQECSNTKISVSAQLLDDTEANSIFEALRREMDKHGLLTHRWRPHDRAGLLNKTRYKNKVRHETLGGCSLDNRTSDWLHINANGKIVMCCQDYFERYVLGDLHNSTLEDIVVGEARRRYHDWTIGNAVAPKDYLCRTCSFAKPEVREKYSREVTSGG